MKNIVTLLFLFCCSFAISAQTFINYTEEDGLIDNAVNCLAVDANNGVWFGTQNGVSYFDGTNWTNYSIDENALPNETIKAIFVAANGDVWIGTDDGLAVFDGTDWVTYTEEEGLLDNRVKYIHEYPEGTILAGNNDGLSILENGTFTSFGQADGLPFGGVNYVTSDLDGNILMGTPLGGVQIYKDGNWTSLTEDEGLLNDKIRSIAIDEDNKRWVGNSDGISVFDSANIWEEDHEIIFILPPPDELNPVEDVAIDSRGYVWAGVYVDYLVTEGGISVYNGGEWADYDVDDGLVGPVVRRIAVDANDDIWVATSTGVSKVTDIPDLGTGLQQTNDKYAIQAYPNPANDVLFVNLSGYASQQSVEIIDVLGRVVATDTFEGNARLQMPVNHLAPGMYFLRVNEQSLRFLVK